MTSPSPRDLELLAGSLRRGRANLDIVAGAIETGDWALACKALTDLNVGLPFMIESVLGTFGAPAALVLDEVDAAHARWHADLCARTLGDEWMWGR